MHFNKPVLFEYLSYRMKLNLFLYAFDQCTFFPSLYGGAAFFLFFTVFIYWIFGVLFFLF